MKLELLCLCRRIILIKLCNNLAEDFPKFCKTIDLQFFYYIFLMSEIDPLIAQQSSMILTIFYNAIVPMMDLRLCLEFLIVPLSFVNILSNKSLLR